MGCKTNLIVRDGTEVRALIGEDPRVPSPSASVKCGARPWTTTVRDTMCRGNAACTHALFLPYKWIFLAPATICPTLFLSLDLDSRHGRPHGLPRRNMLARTSDTLGFGVCRAVPITPRRIPSVIPISWDVRRWYNVRIETNPSLHAPCPTNFLAERARQVPRWILTKMIACLIFLGIFNAEFCRTNLYLINFLELKGTKSAFCWKKIKIFINSVKMLKKKNIWIKSLFSLLLFRVL